MDPSRFYSRRNVLSIREIPDGSDDSELSDEGDVLENIVPRATAVNEDDAQEENVTDDSTDGMLSTVLPNNKHTNGEINIVCYWV